MSSINFGTGNKTYRQLIGNGLTYVVPAFQRDYSWEEDQWDDLWQDIKNALHADASHYMGYLVLQTTDSKVHLIVDGQQRLTTLSLFVLAVLKNIQALVDRNVEAESNRRRIETLRASYVGYLDPVTLVPQSKLKLNRHNDGYFQTYVVPLQPLPKRNLRESVKRLQQGFEWWDKAIRTHVAASQSGAELARLVDVIADRLFFTVITVSEELKAFTVFETLNARGVRLSPTDLLKNYLFSVVDQGGGVEEELEQLEVRWEKIVTSLGEENFTAFLRVHWNSRNDLTREVELFKVLKARIRDRGAVFSLMREMESDLDSYLDLLYGRLPDPEQQAALDDLRLFGIRQVLSLLLCAKRLMSSDDFATMLRMCAVVIFRYSVIGSQANNDLERACSGAIQAMLKSQVAVTVSAVLPNLRAVYRGDGVFASDFSEKQLKTSQKRNKDLVRHILFALERQLSNAQFEDSAAYNIEHVLPENPEGPVAGFREQRISEYVNRLGNLTLMSTSQNRDLGNQAYASKRPVYSKSVFAITRKIAADFDEWTSERVEQRQLWMAKQATAIWRVNQLS